MNGVTQFWILWNYSFSELNVYSKVDIYSVILGLSKSLQSLSVSFHLGVWLHAKERPAKSEKSKHPGFSGESTLGLVEEAPWV